MVRMLSPWLAMALLACAVDARANDAPGEPADRAATAAAEPTDETPAKEESEEEAEERRILEQVQREHAAEQASVASIREAAAFQERRSIDPPPGSGMVLAFHTLADGGLVIATGAGRGYGEESVTGALASLVGLAGGERKKPPANTLVWLDAAGQQRHAASLPFVCKGLTVAPDGAVIAVGDDRVAVFSPAGEQLAETEAPHFKPTADELAQLREEIAEQYREMLEARREQFDRIVASKAELEKVPEEDRTPRQKLELARADVTMMSYEAALGRLEASADSFVDGALANAHAIHRVAASGDHLFLVAREPAGHAFGVWRCGRDFSDPEKIIGGLSGCCGQMDLQVIGDELVIAENARHHVAVYSFDGEPLRTFGEGSRTDIRKGFGGCCNPMNACAGPDGTLLLSESNGLVKQFTADGTLIDILGAANVLPGCKNSSIGISDDGTRLFYLDSEKGRVLVMERKS
jgi:hypothetical protein